MSRNRELLMGGIMLKTRLGRILTLFPLSGFRSHMIMILVPPVLLLTPIQAEIQELPKSGFQADHISVI